MWISFGRQWCCTVWPVLSTLTCYDSNFLFQVQIDTFNALNLCGIYHFDQLCYYFHYALKFLWTVSDTSFSFLDLSSSRETSYPLIFSINRLTLTAPRYKPPPIPCKDAFPFSQCVHICSQDETFHCRTSETSHVFPKKVISLQMLLMEPSQLFNFPHFCPDPDAPDRTESFPCPCL